VTQNVQPVAGGKRDVDLHFVVFEDSLRDNAGVGIVIDKKDAQAGQRDTPRLHTLNILHGASPGRPGLTQAG
jgi:hypothetical protein